MQCHASVWGVEPIYQNLGRISLLIGFVSAVAHVVYCLIKDRQPELNAAVAKLVGGAVLPPAVAMGLSSIDPENLLGCVTNLELYIFVGAFSVVWITLSVLFPGGFTWKWIRKLSENLGRFPRKPIA
jgi:hypothetical protein